jgi:hypothetical protein
MARALLVAALLLVLVPAGAAREFAGSGHATLKLVKGAPLTVRGAGFKTGERVRLRVWAERVTTRRIAASDQGVFVARFPRVWYDRCAGLTVTAVGHRGSRAALKTPELLCPPRL